MKSPASAIDMGYRVVVAELPYAVRLTTVTRDDLYKQRFDIQIEVAMTNKRLERWSDLS